MSEEQHRVPRSVGRYRSRVGGKSLGSDRGEHEDTDHRESQGSEHHAPASDQPRMYRRSPRCRAERRSGATRHDPQERGEHEGLPHDSFETDRAGQERDAGSEPQAHERRDDGDRERVREPDDRHREQPIADQGSRAAGSRTTGSVEQTKREPRSGQEGDGQPSRRSARRRDVDTDAMERELVEPAELERGGKSQSSAEHVDQGRHRLPNERNDRERTEPALDRGGDLSPQTAADVRSHTVCRRCERLRGSRRRRRVHARAACTSSATWLGVRPTRTPAASSASALAAAVPLEPVTIAPAWPMRLPGGASNPAM